MLSWRAPRRTDTSTGVTLRPQRKGSRPRGTLLRQRSTCQRCGRQIQNPLAPGRSLGETGVGVAKPVVLLVALLAALAGPVSAREPDVPPSQAAFRAELRKYYEMCQTETDPARF